VQSRNVNKIISEVGKQILKYTKKIWAVEAVNHALKLFSICLCATLILSAADALIKIDGEEDTLEKYPEILSEIIPDAEFYELDIMEFEGEVKTVWEAKNSGGVIGYCVLLDIAGLRGPIEMVAGVCEDDGIIVVMGVKIISHNETQGLGSLVTENEFLGQFQSAEINNLQNIQAVTGATASSEIVKSGVMLAAETVRKIIRILETDG